MRRSKLWKKLLDVEHVVPEDGDVETGPDGKEVLVVQLRPDRWDRLRCSGCPCRDDGEGHLACHPRATPGYLHSNPDTINAPRCESRVTETGFGQ